ncbi:TPA: hypothetical protein DDW35_06600 [Candidatus Sumerlaeota bacterium]|jgi:hypothetical protein|nr:hypothetical protein [Candidatus Sumerlaeota bacterium]
MVEFVFETLFEFLGYLFLEIIGAALTFRFFEGKPLLRVVVGVMSWWALLMTVFLVWWRFFR